MLLLKMALRNLWRRKFRTIITITAIGVSYGLLIFFVQFQTGGKEQMANTGIRMQAGHVVIQASGYNLDKELDQAIKDPGTVDRIITETDSAAKVAWRLYTTGSLRSSDGSVLLDRLVGAQPDRERHVSDFPKKLIAGTFLSGKPDEIVIGAAAAKLLQAEVGTKLQLSVSDVNGGIVKVSLRVGGIYKTGGGTVDRGYALVNLARLQKLLRMPGEISQIAIFTDLHSSRGLAQSLREKLKGRGLEVLHWQEALPTLYQVLLVDTASMYIFLIIIFFIVAAGILNSVLMSVLERTRGFGVLKSLGMRPSEILQLILSEAFLMGLLAVIIGLAAGLTISYIVSRYGIDPKDLAGGEQGMEAAGVPMTEKMYPKITAWSCVWSSIFVMVLTLLSALPPSLRAAKILPVKAIRE